MIPIFTKLVESDDYNKCFCHISYGHFHKNIYIERAAKFWGVNSSNNWKGSVWESGVKSYYPHMNENDEFNEKIIFDFYHIQNFSRIVMQQN